jgi:hypothetical protein
MLALPGKGAIISDNYYMPGVTIGQEKMWSEKLGE